MTTPRSDLPLGLIALGALVWGASKGLVNYRAVTAHTCPITREVAFHMATSPGRLLHSVVTGPIMEETSFRAGLQPHLGVLPTAALFGVTHANPGRGPAWNLARGLDAAAGGLIYGKCFERGGLVASTVVHAAHNLGANLGIVLGFFDDALSARAVEPQQLL